MTLPKSFGPASHNWSNKLILGDNLQVLRGLLQQREAGLLKNADGTDGIRLCYIDPPFATRREFVGARDQKAYDDRVAEAQFIEHLRRRVILIRELLAIDGTCFVHLDQRKVHYVKVMLDEIFGEQNFVSEVVWSYGSASGGRAKGNKLVKGHETLLVYARRYGQSIFNHQVLPYSDKYVSDWFKWDEEDGRGPYRKRWRRDAEGESYAERQYLKDSPGMPLSTVWSDIQQLYADPRAYKPEQAEHSEITGYPTQKPRKLLERIVSLSSNEGDIVMDCFVGSGTTVDAASLLGRRWIGVDCGKFATYTTEARLLRAAGGAEHASFTTYNAGLYDYEALRSLDFSAYRDFALRLFQCRPEVAELGGFSFDGLLDDDRVHVYDFSSQGPEAQIGAEYVNDIATLAGSHLGQRCFVIAPARLVEPYEDYLEVSGIRFFFLRIPYSVIAQLHKRAFSELRQPESQELANATLDAVGFDFIQPPAVEAVHILRDGALETHIVRFVSQAYEADESEDDIAGLALVMVDQDYDGEIFDVNAVFFASELAKSDWRFTISAETAGDLVLIVYVDVYGNEHREAKPTDEFKNAGESGGAEA